MTDVPTLLVEHPSGFTELHSLRASRTQVGRARTNDLMLDDARVSREHAVITVDGAFVLIEDLGSRNGVYVNGRKVTIDALASGDVVTIGDCTLRFTAHHTDYSRIEAEPLSSVPGLRFLPDTTRDTEK
jgi:pSer/pThr/pTyr-binding forkhead associated (FHA) protein